MSPKRGSAGSCMRMRRSVFRWHKTVLLTAAPGCAHSMRHLTQHVGSSSIRLLPLVRVSCSPLLGFVLRGTAARPGELPFHPVTAWWVGGIDQCGLGHIYCLFMFLDIGRLEALPWLPRRLELAFGWVGDIPAIRLEGSPASWLLLFWARKREVTRPPAGGRKPAAGEPASDIANSHHKRHPPPTHGQSLV